MLRLIYFNNTSSQPNTEHIKQCTVHNQKTLNDRVPCRQGSPYDDTCVECWNLAGWIYLCLVTITHISRHLLISVSILTFPSVNPFQIAQYINLSEMYKFSIFWTSIPTDIEPILFLLRLPEFINIYDCNPTLSGAWWSCRLPGNNLW